jgi:hypothetical protein
VRRIADPVITVRRKEPDLFRSGRARYRIAEPLITFYQAIMSREWARLELGGAAAVWPGADAEAVGTPAMATRRPSRLALIRSVSRCEWARHGWRTSAAAGHHGPFGKRIF